MKDFKKLSRNEMRKISAGKDNYCTILCHTVHGQQTVSGFGTCMNDTQNCQAYFEDPTAYAISCSCIGGA